ncbi:hypothetical protein AB9128_00800 [Streptomyces cinereoruber]|uniref:hypothetical protein n=1 Tax=Streptomyces cinereoruber TaxID=67260 RepID=UPI003EC048AF
MTGSPDTPDEGSHATVLRERWALPEHAAFLTALRAVLTGGAGDWRAVART